MNIPNITIPNITIPKLNTINQTSFDLSNLHTPSTILVLGNGFDLDLNMATSYNSFAHDKDFWPFKDDGQYGPLSLPYFLNKNINNVGSWFDLEELLAKYANLRKTTDKCIVKKDIAYLEELKSSLVAYLKKQEDIFVSNLRSNTHAKRETPSRYVLRRILDKNFEKENVSIYTFNYTDISRISHEIILDTKAHFNHVHGSINSKDIILGAGDSKEINDDYFPFYKSASKNYKSSNLVEDLLNADNVYIFGHSLGENDHDYFSEFFKMATKSRKKTFVYDKIKLRIFTYDENSELDIKKQLMKLTDKHLIGLYAHCDFKILKTALSYQSNWMNADSEIW